LWIEARLTHSRWHQDSLPSFELSLSPGVRWSPLEGTVRPSLSLHAGYRFVRSEVSPSLFNRWELLPIQLGGRVELFFDERLAVFVEAAAANHLNYGPLIGFLFGGVGFTARFG
jgi:hypothetical protein